MLSVTAHFDCLGDFGCLDCLSVERASRTIQRQRHQDSAQYRRASISDWTAVCSPACRPYIKTVTESSQRDAYAPRSPPCTSSPNGSLKQQSSISPPLQSEENCNRHRDLASDLSCRSGRPSPIARSRSTPQFEQRGGCRRLRRTRFIDPPLATSDASGGGRWRRRASAAIDQTI